jgi:cyclic pyranopterin phosphate synthase
MDKFRIDSHKLMFHIDRVQQWSRKNDIYPIYIEIAPCGGCNHRCKFCALDYLGYKPNYLETQRAECFLSEIASNGVKSIMFAGEGEPLLHKDIARLVSSAKKAGWM